MAGLKNLYFNVSIRLSLQSTHTEFGVDPGDTSYISEYGDCGPVYVYFSALQLYDKVFYQASNYINSPFSHF